MLEINFLERVGFNSKEELSILLKSYFWKVGSHLKMYLAPVLAKIPSWRLVPLGRSDEETELSRN